MQLAEDAAYVRPPAPSHPFMYFPAFYSIKAIAYDQPIIEYASTKYKNEIWDSVRALWCVWVPAQVSSRVLLSTPCSAVRQCRLLRVSAAMPMPMVCCCRSCDVACAEGTAVVAITQLINFGVVPMHFRIPYVAGVSFLWTVILSVMQGNAACAIAIPAAAATRPSLVPSSSRGYLCCAPKPHSGMLSNASTCTLRGMQERPHNEVDLISAPPCRV